MLAALAAATDPVALVTATVARYGLRERAAELVTIADLPVAVTPTDKGAIDESLPQFLGLYAGESSQPAAVRDVVEQADLVLDIGGAVLAELNTGLWSDLLDVNRAVCIHDNWVRIGHNVFLNVAIEDVLGALLQRVEPKKSARSATERLLPLAGSADDSTSSASFYPRLQRRMKAGDTLVVETGTCMLHLNGMQLPAGVGVEGQGLWGSIGWATPACLGVDLAKTSGRTWLVTGDGSHQLTFNEIAVMGRYRIKPVIFVLNNGIFGIEVVISEWGHPYDDLAPVEYHRLPAAFGCAGWLSARVTTVAELDKVLDAIDGHDGGCYVEVMIPAEESQPLPPEILDRAYKLRTPDPT